MVGVASATTLDEGRSDPRTRRRPTFVLLVALAAALFLGYGARTIVAPFGDSHDGRNAGVWAAGSRSLRESGPVASRLGTRSPENGVYANHPPLIYLETAAAELVGPRSTATTRAPAWLGSLLALVLLFRLLRERGLGSAAAGTAVLLAVATPMFLIYGTMLDTPVTSLPFGLGLLVLWERARRGDPVRPLAAGVLAALAVLAGWQALLVSGAVAVWAAVRLVRRGIRQPGAERAFVIGTLAGVGLLGGWLLWAFGGTLRPLLEQFQYRTGPKVGLSDLVVGQWGDLARMFGFVAVLAVAGLVLALRSEQARGLACLALGVTIPYPLAFRSGAMNHNYWDYWFLLPLAIGLGVGGERVLRIWTARGRPEPVVVGAAALLATLMVLTISARPPEAEAVKLAGFGAGSAALGVTLDVGQGTAWYAGAVGEPASWLALATRRPALAVAPSGYAALAADRPNEKVFVGEVRCAGGRDVRTFELRPAGSLLDRPPRIAPCS